MVDRSGGVDYTCSCRLGFSGPLCLTPRDNACLANPCRNGGTCDLLTLTEYKCRCPPGWSGKGPSARPCPRCPQNVMYGRCPAPVCGWERVLGYL